MVTEVKKYKTVDGKEFNTLARATAHEQYLDLTRYFPNSSENAVKGESVVYQVLTHLLMARRIAIPGSPKEGP